MNSKSIVREKLKSKISSKYNKFSDFAKDAQISTIKLGEILRGEIEGSYYFWKQTKKILSISDEQILLYKDENKLLKNNIIEQIYS